MRNGSKVKFQEPLKFKRKAEEETSAWMTEKGVSIRNEGTKSEGGETND